MIGARISGATAVAGVIGDPVDHSLSPLLHNAAFEATGIDWTYVAFPVAAADGGSVVAAMKAFGVRGLSVTMPHKQAVARTADIVSDDVRSLGAANTLVLDTDRRVRAETTDGAGCADALRAEGVVLDGARVLVLGAGGAGRAVVQGLFRAGVRDIVVVNRDRARAESAVALAPGVARLGSSDEADECSVIINATSVGMGTPEADPAFSADQTPAASALPPDRFPIDPRRLGSGQVVNDLIYHPLETPLLAIAHRRGAKVVGGVGMLLHQAGRQFQLWTGVEAPLPAMETALRAELARRATPSLPIHADRSSPAAP